MLNIARWMLLAAMIVAIPFASWTQDEGRSCEAFLFDLPGIRFERIAAPWAPSGTAWELQFEQPLDHANPDAGNFFQRVYVTELNPERPTVLVTEGYNRNNNYPGELTTSIGANQVIVEHRYYGESVPDSMDYAYLDIKQAAQDLHRIRTVLGEYFTGPWVASGISKGGQTTIFYRYFFPEDVAASVPYVAPLNLALEDERIYDFLRKVGSRQCRKNIEAIQFRILKDYDESLLRLNWHARGQALRFNYLTIEEAFEYAVLEYPFSFWQWGADCNAIPDADGPLDEVLDHFLSVSGMSFFSDEGMEDYASHYYQCADELGYYGYENEKFNALLRALPKSSHPSAIFTPQHMEVKYDGGALAQDVYEWVQANGDAFVYINGAIDTWSATAMPPNKSLDALYFFLKNQNHGTARIRNMDNEQKQQLKLHLERWLGLPITGSLAN
ncbi:MAG TPA: hypothetical protein DD635_02030 [Flavobacteriales bacterium]|nr:hypothetical protein [Flavobacteriales bacterium]